MANGVDDFQVRGVDPAKFGAAFLAFFEGETAHSPEHPRRVLEEGECALWLAFVGEQAAGGILAREEHPEVGGAVGLAENLIVHRDWRRRGLGRLLMETAEGDFRGRGFVAMQLSTDVWNAAAIALYTSLGFQTILRYERVRNGATSERLRMRKEFRSG